jgi:hypothetical protein
MIVAKEDDLPLRTAPPTQPRGVRPPSICKLANQKRDCLTIFLTESLPKSGLLHIAIYRKCLPKSSPKKSDRKTGSFPTLIQSSMST